MATSMSSRSPGVWTVVLPNWTWKPETPASDPAGARISAGKSGSVLTVVAGQGGGVRELGAGQLHAVAGVAGEADGAPKTSTGRGAGAGCGRGPGSGRRHAISTVTE